jgi:hypothetical protein
MSTTESIPVWVFWSSQPYDAALDEFNDVKFQSRAGFSACRNSRIEYSNSRVPDCFNSVVDFLYEDGPLSEARSPINSLQASPKIQLESIYVA